MAITRRPFLLEEGEQLILSEDVITQTAGRLGEFIEKTGLDPVDVVSDPIVTTPLPLYRQGQRFPQVSADMMWHPLFWLPERIALRFQVDTGDGNVRPELDVEWAVRVALELQGAGLYDAAEGGWLDVLAVFGLDIDNPVDLARVEAWQQGEADEQLDGIDISTMLAGESDEQMFSRAAELIEIALPAQFGLTAARLNAHLEEHPEDVGVVAMLGAEMLVDVPTTVPDALHEIGEAILDRGEDGAGHLSTVQEALGAVIDEYYDAVVEMSGGEDTEADPAPAQTA